MSQIKTNKKILSLQAFSLYENGGGGRLLRRLYENNESNVISLVVSEYRINSKVGKIREEIIYAYPIQKKWMKWRLRGFFKWIRVEVLQLPTAKIVSKLARSITYDIIHVVNHGHFSAALVDTSIAAKKPLWVSFHDHFLAACPESDTKKLWLAADRRLVISDELGREYQKLFGKLKYELITDGVHQEEIKIDPPLIRSDRTTIYFAGLLHYEYLPLFRALADTLDSMTRQGYNFNLVIRGASNIDFLKNRSFVTEYRTDFATDEEVKKEMDEAHILYLPIKFTTPEFALYSLSTKMVSYLGSLGTILYHGPVDSAAYTLLQKSKAALCCTSLDTKELTEQILLVLHKEHQYSNNAKILARNQFDMTKIQKRFWQIEDQKDTGTNAIPVRMK